MCSNGNLKMEWLTQNLCVFPERQAAQGRKDILRRSLPRCFCTSHDLAPASGCKVAIHMVTTSQLVGKGKGRSSVMAFLWRWAGSHLYHFSSRPFSPESVMWQRRLHGGLGNVPVS